MSGEMPLHQRPNYRYVIIGGNFTGFLFAQCVVFVEANIPNKGVILLIGWLASFAPLSLFIQKKKLGICIAINRNRMPKINSLSKIVVSTVIKLFGIIRKNGKFIGGTI